MATIYAEYNGDKITQTICVNFSIWNSHQIFLTYIIRYHSLSLALPLCLFLVPHNSICSSLVITNWIIYIKFPREARQKKKKRLWVIFWGVNPAGSSSSSHWECRKRWKIFIIVMLIKVFTVYLSLTWVFNSLDVLSYVKSFGVAL